MTTGCIISAAQRGDERAARGLYREYASGVRRAVIYNGGAEDVEDLCQETWLRIFRYLGSFRGEANFGTWAHAIARNVVLDWARGRSRSESLVGPGVIDVNAVARPRHLDVGIDVQRALEVLPPGMRDVLALYVEGFTHEEVGTALGIAAGTSKSQLSKARAKVRVRIASDAASADAA